MEFSKIRESGRMPDGNCKFPDNHFGSVTSGRFRLPPFSISSASYVCHPRIHVARHEKRNKAPVAHTDDISLQLQVTSCSPCYLAWPSASFVRSYVDYCVYGIDLKLSVEDSEARKDRFACSKHPRCLDLCRERYLRNIIFFL